MENIGLAIRREKVKETSLKKQGERGVQRRLGWTSPPKFNLIEDSLISIYFPRGSLPSELHRDKEGEIQPVKLKK